MGKTKFVHEFEINASKKMLYPYLNTASGLSQWYADDVNVDEDKLYHFFWEATDHKAKLVAHRTNGFVKFEFLGDNGEMDEDPDFVEIRLEENELTQSVYLKVTEYTEFDDKEEQKEVWENLLYTLKELVGG